MAEKATIKMVVRYDGSGFHGFQRQKTGERTVQGVIEGALGVLLGRDTTVTGASRTDAGVHALGQTVSFEAECDIPPERMAAALSAHLPVDLGAVSSERAPEGFSARFDARGKTYTYLCHRGAHPHPLLRDRALNIPSGFERAAAVAAVAEFVGTHDFSAFENQGSSPRDPVKTIEGFSVDEFGSFVAFTVTGSGFLYKMVRNMAGAAVEAGLGKFPPERVREALETGKRELGGPTLPAHGLYLVRVYYGDDMEHPQNRHDFI